MKAAVSWLVPLLVHISHLKLHLNYALYSVESLIFYSTGSSVNASKQQVFTPFNPFQCLFVISSNIQSFVVSFHRAWCAIFVKHEQQTHILIGSPGIISLVHATWFTIPFRSSQNPLIPAINRNAKNKCSLSLFVAIIRVPFFFIYSSTCNLLSHNRMRPECVKRYWVHRIKER